MPIIEGGIEKAQIVDDSGDNINSDNPLNVEIPPLISTLNSSATPLLADAVFPGSGELINGYGIIYINVYSDVASATDGLKIFQSSNGTNWDHDDAFTIPANTGKNFSINPYAKYCKVEYTNGGDDQGAFRLQTIYKGNGRPTSHRIQDSIIDDDDAELVTNVNKAKSQLTGYFENITSYREALNVNSAWLHRKIVNETFHQHDTSTTLASIASAGDTSITVDDATGFITGDYIKIEETVAGVGVQEVGILTITNVVGVVLTLDRPIGFDYTTAAVVSEVYVNMAVSGSLASPQIFEIDPPPGTVWQFTRILFNITDQSAMDDAKFGGISALTNGVSLRATTASGRTVVFGNWKNNSDMKLDMYDINYSDKAPAGFFGLTGRWTFTKAEVVAELDGDASPVQKLEVLIQDDLTDLDTFRMRGQGRVFSP